MNSIEQPSALAPKLTVRLLHLLFGATRGGCEHDALVLIQGMPNVEHRVCVVGTDGPMVKEWQAAGAEVRFCPSMSPSNSELIRWIVENTRDTNAVMVWHGMIKLPQIINAVNRNKVVCAVHGGNPATMLKRLVDWKFVILEWLYRPRGPKPIYICCSQYVADSFECSRYLRRFPRIVVPNAVVAPIAGIHKPKKYDPNVAFKIGMVARMSPIKDHRTLIEAFALIAPEFPNIKLQLAGAGILEKELYNRSIQLGLGARIDFLGDTQDVYSVLATWDLFAYATTPSEGLGNAVTEAMMAGLPCVLTDIGPMREFVGNDRSVHLVKPYDPRAMASAIRQLIFDYDERVRLSAAGYAWANENFSIERFVNEHARLLQLPNDSGRQAKDSN